MSVSDELMWRYFDLLSFRGNDEIARFKREVADGRNPRDVKVLLGREIVARFHSVAKAEAALAEFEARFQRGVLPDDMPEISVAAGSLAQILKAAGLTSSTSDALRMIEGGGVRINGEKVGDRSTALAAGECVVLQVGKRKFARVTLICKCDSDDFLLKLLTEAFAIRIMRPSLLQDCIVCSNVL
jgi:tyrosyl-tRNA synthetase